MKIWVRKIHKNIFEKEQPWHDHYEISLTIFFFQDNDDIQVNVKYWHQGPEE